MQKDIFFKHKHTSKLPNRSIQLRIYCVLILITILIIKYIVQNENGL